MKKLIYTPILITIVLFCLQGLWLNKIHHAYMVLLYRNSKRIGHPHKTQGTTYDFSPLMRERGIYHYKANYLTTIDISFLWQPGNVKGIGN